MSSISGTVGSFQSGEAFTGRRGLTIVSAVHMAAGLADCRKALVGTGLSFSLPFDTNGRR